jgi:hypothetical protein
MVKAPAVAEALVYLHKSIVAGCGYLIGQGLFGLFCVGWRVLGVDKNLRRRVGWSVRARVSLCPSLSCEFRAEGNPIASVGLSTANRSGTWTSSSTGWGTDVVCVS